MTDTETSGPQAGEHGQTETSGGEGKSVFKFRDPGDATPVPDIMTILNAIMEDAAATRSMVQDLWDGVQEMDEEGDWVAVTATLPNGDPVEAVFQTPSVVVARAQACKMWNCLWGDLTNVTITTSEGE